MPPNRRINITLPKRLSVFLKKISLRDDVSESAKARELLEFAMDLEEDDYFSEEANRREKNTRKWLKHDSFWASLT